MRQPNFLILDEPTNDLDIVTLGILEDYLVNYKGCAIIISHDRYFLDNIVDHLFVMEGDGEVRDFPGNYSDWRQYCSEKAKISVSATPTDAKPAQRTTMERKPRLTFKERKEYEALTTEIDELSAEKNSLEESFSKGEGDIAALSLRYNEVKNRLDEAELRWLELSEKA